MLYVFMVVSVMLQAEEGLNKVVFDLTTSNTANFEKKILQGIAAHKNYYESKLGELEVAVVIHGGAYRFFVKDLDNTIFKDDAVLQKEYAGLKKRIKTMSETYDVKFLMCGAAMKRNKLEKAQIVEFVQIVPNSTIGLIDKQNEGFAYIPVRD
jgi:intracellular sulfur oxidation DsrE/DsrF family protein